jgi:hypothetical protein
MRDSRVTRQQDMEIFPISGEIMDRVGKITSSHVVCGIKHCVASMAQVWRDIVQGRDPASLIEDRDYHGGSYPNIGLANAIVRQSAALIPTQLSACINQQQTPIISDIFLYLAMLAH